MEKALNSSDFFHKKQDSEWQLLGELTLSNESAGDEPLHSWLTDLLQALSLPPELLGRVAKSAQEAVAHALQSELKLEHIHLKIFGPLGATSVGQTWGFFGVERIEDPTEDGLSASHAVRFYLYPENLEGTEPSR